MAERVVHAVVTQYEGYGFGLTSPQLPSFVGGFDAPESPFDEIVARLLHEAGAPAEFTLKLHFQRMFERDDRRWFIRVEEDRLPSRAHARSSAAGHLMELLDQTLEPVDEARRDATGDPIFVVALETDSVAWVEDQLENDDWVMVVVDTPDNAIAIFPLGRVKDLPQGRSRLPRTMSVGELIAGIDFDVVEGNFTLSARESAKPVLVSA